jgi:hypothetical protein
MRREKETSKLYKKFKSTMPNTANTAIMIGW